MHAVWVEGQERTVWRLRDICFYQRHGAETATK